MINLDDYEEINLDDYEEISGDEFWRLNDEIGRMRIVVNGSYESYFKKKPKDVFEDNFYRIILEKDGSGIEIRSSETHKFMMFEDSLPLLEQAIAEAKKRRLEADVRRRGK